MTRARAFPVLLVLTAGLAAPASASAWTGVFPVSVPSATDDTSEPDVGVDNAGNAVAVWLQTSNPASSAAWQVRAASIAPGTVGWTAMPALSAVGARPSFSLAEGARNLALGVSGGGAAVAAWSQNPGGTIQSARLASSDAPAFGSATPLGGFTCAEDPTKTDGDVAGPAVALDNSGQGHVAWQAPCSNDDNSRWVLFRQTTPDGYATTTKSAGHQDDSENAPVGPKLAIDSATGRTVMLFVDAPCPSPIVSRDLQGNDTFGSKQTVVPSVGNCKRVMEERIAFLPGGKQVTVYRENGGGTRIFALVDGTSTELSVGSGGGLAPQLAVGADGTVVVAWFENGYWAAVRNPTTGAWGPAHRLSDSEGNPSDLDIAVSDEGTGYAVWKRDAGTSVNLEGAILDPDDPSRSPGTPYQFQPVPETLFDATAAGTGGDADQPRVDVSPGGNATVVFRAIVDLGPPTRRGIFFLRNVKSPVPARPPAPTPPPGPAPISGPPRDLRAPRVTAFNSLRSVFAKGTKEGQIVAQRGDETAINPLLRVPLKVGTRLRWTADEAGSATIVIRHTGCRKFRKYNGHSVAKNEECKASARPDGTVAVLRTRSRRGASSVTWLGKTLAGKRLRIGGVYTATLVVVDPSGNRSAGRSVAMSVDEPFKK